MIPAQWQAVRDVFVAALEVDEPDRAEFVSRETTDHPEVRQEVQRLLRLHQKAGTFLETSDETVDRQQPLLLSPGEVIAERFEVVRAIGQGGMGEVYEASDRLLNERVALKVMRPAIGDARATTERFRREVQSARRVTHPGVCRVHDVALHRGREGQPLLVLTMELLVGETLAERLRHGPIAPAEAIRIAVDIAAALDAAHRHGIVHGDIKPENVILSPAHDPNGRVVLTDFGLARGHGAQLGLTESTLMGTPAYMAPELFRGDPPSVASDMYAFALLCYRLISPIDDVAVPLGTRVLTRGPREVLPAGLELLDTHPRRLLTNALSVDPAGRARTATEFTRALFRLHKPRFRMLVSGGLAAVIALAVVWFLPTKQTVTSDPPSGTGAPTVVLLAKAENRTDEADLDGLTEVLRSQLAQSPRLDVLEPEGDASVLAEMRQDATQPRSPLQHREVALRRGATMLLTPVIRKSAGGFELDLLLERIGARPSIVEQQWQETFRAATLQELFTVTRRATVWARETVGESPAQRADQDRPPAEITTTSWEALRLFARATDSYERGDLPTAVVQFQEAVRLDPEFVSGHMRLGDVLISLRRETEGYAAWRRAVELGNTRQLTTREVLRLRGQYFEDTGQLREAEQAFRAYALHYPADYNANMFLASILSALGRPQEAVPWLRQAARLQPSAAAGHVHLASALIELGQIDEAVTVIADLRAAGQTEWATWMTALVEFTRGRLPAALNTLTGLQTADRGWVSRRSTLRASWLVELGRPLDAESELRTGIAYDGAQGFRDREALKWLHLAELRRRAGDVGQAVDSVARAQTTSSDMRTLTLAGSLLARMGRRDAARRALSELERLGDMPRTRVSQQRVAGEILLAEGQPVQALTRFEDASRTARARESRMFYVRGLASAGRADEALALLVEWTDRPARFYGGPEPEWPGGWSVAMAERSQLLRHLGRLNDAAAIDERLTSVRAAGP